MSIEALLNSGEFLELSRRQPHYFDLPLHFQLDNHTQVNVIGPGIIVFEPENAGNKDIVLSCGVHGNETAPIEICDQFVRDALTGQISLAHRVLFIFGNLPSMDIAKRFVDENMNRLFSGAHSQPPGLINPERHRAKLLEQVVGAFFAKGGEGGMDGKGRERIHYDLHTAIRDSKNEKFAVYPFLNGKPHSKSQLAFMAACGVKTIMLSQSPTTTFSYFSHAAFNAHTFTVELGKVRPFGQNDMRRFEQARQKLLALITQVDVELPEYADCDLELFSVNQIINRTKEDFTLHFDDDTPNFTDFPLGYVLASEPGVEYKIQVQGEAIVFPNAKVALGQRALLTVIPGKLDE